MDGPSRKGVCPVKCWVPYPEGLLKGCTQGSDMDEIPRSGHLWLSWEYEMEHDNRLGLMAGPQ